jgi:hypothetical protein
MKLTKPQEALLRELAEESRYVACQYKPGIRLVELGLAKNIGWRHLAITEAGRQWIKERDAK